jgi:hypothetical protein
MAPRGSGEWEAGSRGGRQGATPGAQEADGWRGGRVRAASARAGGRGRPRQRRGAAPGAREAGQPPTRPLPGSSLFLCLC